ncbi:MAG: aminoacyl-histidine dipeptidase [Holdemanella sp.]|nr:aminoacyl-histidine dipeptidase [Holdemanella sp.]
MLENLKPYNVWKYFEKLCSIPHGSYNEKGISDYVVQFAKERNLEVYQDEVYNVIIIKEASQGYEDKKPIILQGHMDMVCEKAPGSDFDFEKDSLILEVNGDYVSAKDTTLGGDDGIAVAMELAILDDDTLQHPRLECIFTVSEEVGLDGAKALDTTPLKGNYLINIDSEEEGYFTVGCAGGCRVDISKEIKKVNKTGNLVKIKVDGLKGGHSGVEINKNLGNANKIMADVLKMIKDFDLISLKGGSKDNAITRVCEAAIIVDPLKLSCIEACNAYYKELYKLSDPDINITYEVVGLKDVQVLNAFDKDELIWFMTNLSNGVMKMSKNIKGLPGTSSNLGVVNVDESIKLTTSLRSESIKDKETLLKAIKHMAALCNYTVNVRGDYPAWEYKEDSILREKMKEIYVSMYGKEPIVMSIHAGLECGILSSKIENMDAVSIGPDMFDIHTYAERISISSVERVYTFVLEVLKSL